MLAHTDGYFVHQAVDTLGHVSSTDARWYERFWVNLQCDRAAVALAHGMGVYPNLNVMDGYALVVHDGKQTNVRVSRQLDGDRENLNVGPLHAEILQGLRSWRLVLEENAFGVSYDVCFDGIAPPTEWPQTVRRVDNRLEASMHHFDQSGRCRGWIKIKGSTFDVDHGNCWAIRDRSWGVRTHVGGPQASGGRYFPEFWPSPTFSHFFGQMPEFHVQFSSVDMKAARGAIQHRWNDPRGLANIVSAVPHNVRWDEQSGQFRSATWEIALETEQVFRISAEHIATIYLRGGAYSGIDGYWHGMYRGPLMVEGECWDLRDSSVISKIDAQNDHIVELRSQFGVGYGSLERYFEQTQLALP